MATIYIFISALVVWLWVYVLMSYHVLSAGGMAARIGSKFQRSVLEPLSHCLIVRMLMGNELWSASCNALLKHLKRMSYDVAPEGITAIFLTVCTGLFCVGCGFSHSLVGGIFLCAALTIGFFSLPGMEERLHKKKLAAEMPGIFRTLAVALGCGQTLSQAIEYVALHERGIAAHGFMRASLRLRCGMKSSEVLSLMVQEIDAPGISLLATALIISQRTGSPLRDLFQKSAMLVERQHEIERTLSVKTAQVRLSVKVVCALPVILVGVLSLISTDFQKGLVTPIGTACVLIACALDALALMIIRRLMRGVM